MPPSQLGRHSRGLKFGQALLDPRYELALSICSDPSARTFAIGSATVARFLERKAGNPEEVKGFLEILRVQSLDEECFNIVRWNGLVVGIAWDNLLSFSVLLRKSSEQHRRHECQLGFFRRRRR